LSILLIASLASLRSLQLSKIRFRDNPSGLFSRAILALPGDEFHRMNAVPRETRTWAEVRLDAIVANAGAVRKAVGPDPEILAVVKANAYGHGAERVAQALAGCVDYFGVACVDEGVAVADAGPRIMLLSPCLPAERAEAVRRGFIATVSSAIEARAFAAEGPALLNFKIDTGMGRIGCWKDDAAREVAEAAAIPGATIHSISTHLPSSDEDSAFTTGQLEGFACLRATLEPLAPHAKFHSLNSAGIFSFPIHAADIVRAGLALYGCACPGNFQGLLEPALTWKARLLTVRDMAAGRTISYGRTYVTPAPMRVASISVGYADGFPRQASGRGAHVLVGGVRCPVLGRVTMDQIVADVSHVPGAIEGDEVVLTGKQGKEEISLHELAAWSDTIAWDILTGLSPRVRRFYHPVSWPPPGPQAPMARQPPGTLPS
jgi:alanine racemase